MFYIQACKSRLALYNLLTPLYLLCAEMDRKIGTFHSCFEWLLCTYYLTPVFSIPSPVCHTKATFGRKFLLKSYNFLLFSSLFISKGEKEVAKCKEKWLVVAATAACTVTTVTATTISKNVLDLFSLFPDCQSLTLSLYFFFRWLLFSIFLSLSSCIAWSTWRKKTFLHDLCSQAVKQSVRQVACIIALLHICIWLWPVQRKASQETNMTI